MVKKAVGFHEIHGVAFRISIKPWGFFEICNIAPLLVQTVAANESVAKFQDTAQRKKEV